MKLKAKPKIAALALATALAIPISAPISTTTAQASGIPTVDVVAIAQAVLEVMESIQQTTTMIDQYQTQMQQYEDQLRHSLAPAAYIWEQASLTQSKLERAKAMLDVYDRQLGGLEGYLGQFKDVNWYKRSPCFSKNGCTPEELKAMREVQERILTEQNNAQLDTNQKSVELAALQIKVAESASQQIKQIQNQASSAQGELQAIGATNQFASLQGEQLININHQLSALIQILARQAEYAQQTQANEQEFSKHVLSTDNVKKTSQHKVWLP